MLLNPSNSNLIGKIFELLKVSSIQAFEGKEGFNEREFDVQKSHTKVFLIVIKDRLKVRIKNQWWFFNLFFPTIFMHIIYYIMRDKM